MKKLNFQNDLPDQQKFDGLNPAFSKGFSARMTATQAAKKKVLIKQQYRFASSTFFSNNIAQKALGASTRRAYLLIQNNGTVDVIIGFGTTPKVDGTDGVIIPPNGGITFETGIAPNNEVLVISSSSCRLTIMEGIG